MACRDLQNEVMILSQNLIGRLQERSAELSQQIQGEAKDLDPELDTSGPDAWIGLDIEVGWNTVEFSLDLPEVTLRDQTWSLDLPQMTMQDQDIIFHTPSIRMDRVKTGEYPEITCGWHTTDGPFGTKFDTWQCTTTFSPIYMDVPVAFMQEQRIRMGVPSFRMERTELILGIPEFAMRTQSFSLGLPSFKVRDMKVIVAETQEKGQALQQSAKARAQALKDNFGESAKAELAPKVTDLFYCYENDLAQRRNEALEQFDRSIGAMQAMVTSLVSSKCPADDPALVAANVNVAQAIAAREAFCQQIEAAFKRLHDEQTAFFNRLIPVA